MLLKFLVPQQRKNGGVRKRAVKPQSKARSRRSTQSASFGRVQTVPSALAQTTRNTPGRLAQAGRAFKVSRSEFITTIVSSTGFSNTVFRLNPGIAATFPWLSSIAIKYDEYHVNKMQFFLKTRVGSGTTGSVIIAPDYDAGDPPPASEDQACAAAGCIEGAAWSNFECPLDVRACHPNGPRKFTRDSAVLGDIRNFDIGTLNVSTIGMNADGVQICKLWVTYDIDFYVPQLVTTGTAVLSPSTTEYITPANYTLTSAVAQPLLPSTAATTINGLGLPTTDATGAVTLPAGEYILNASTTVEDLKGVGGNLRTYFNIGGAEIGNFYATVPPGAGGRASMNSQFTALLAVPTVIQVLGNLAGIAGPVLQALSTLRVTKIA